MINLKTKKPSQNKKKKKNLTECPLDGPATRYTWMNYTRYVSTLKKKKKI